MLRTVKINDQNKLTEVDHIETTIKQAAIGLVNHSMLLSIGVFDALLLANVETQIRIFQDVVKLRDDILDKESHIGDGIDEQ